MMCAISLRLLALLFFTNSPASEGNAEFWSSSLAAKTEARFLISEGNTVVHASQAEMRSSLKGAGFVGAQTRSPGVAYDIPNGVTVRAMEPSGPNTWRASFNNISGTRVTPEGVVPQPPRGLTPAERTE